MDPKQTQMVRDLHASIAGGDFGEREVHSLLGLLRDESPTRSVLREIGDLLAHRRRTEGRVHEYLRRLKEQAGNFMKSGGYPPAPGLIFTEAQIAKALDDGLRRHGLPPFSQERGPQLVPTAQARSRQVQLVMLSLLQRVALQYEGKEFGWLELWVTPDSFQLMGAAILEKGQMACWATPALAVGNDFCPVYIRPPRPRDVFKIFVEGGHTRIHGPW